MDEQPKFRGTSDAPIQIDESFSPADVKKIRVGFKREIRKEKAGEKRMIMMKMSLKNGAPCTMVLYIMTTQKHGFGHWNISV